MLIGLARLKNQNLNMRSLLNKFKPPLDDMMQLCNRCGKYLGNHRAVDGACPKEASKMKSVKDCYNDKQYFQKIPRKNKYQMINNDE